MCFGSTEDLWTEVGEENLGVLSVEYRDQSKIQDKSWEPILHKRNLIVTGFLTRTPTMEKVNYTLAGFKRSWKTTNWILPNKEAEIKWNG